jgi:NADPH:quinone reductase-like Zn-dependent oxidoreductase
MLVAPVVGRATGRWMGLLLWWKPFHQPDVERIAALYAEGRLKPAVDRRFPLEQIVDALRHVDEGRAKGKVVITFAEE